MSNSIKIFLLSICLPLTLVTLPSFTSHAISISFESKKSADTIELGELLASAQKALEGAHRVSASLEPEGRDIKSEGLNSVVEMARSSGQFFGHYVRRFFEESIKSRSFNAEELDQVTYSYMKAAAELPYVAQRQLINSMRDEVKTVKFPKYGSAIVPEVNRRSLFKMNMIWKGIMLAGTGYFIFTQPIVFDLNPKIWYGVAGGFFAPEIGYGTYKLAGQIRKLLRRSLSAEEVRQYYNAENRAQEFKSAALPSDCSPMLMAEMTAEARGEAGYDQGPDNSEKKP